jgi:hypothetical protein
LTKENNTVCNTRQKARNTNADCGKHIQYMSNFKKKIQYMSQFSKKDEHWCLVGPSSQASCFGYKLEERRQTKASLGPAHVPQTTSTHRPFYLNLCSSSSRGIVKNQDQDGFRWRFTGIYGEPTTEKRENTWKLLRILNQQLNLPWLCTGDFNEILYSHEKKGARIGHHNKWRNFEWHSLTADCVTLVIWGISIHGEIIITRPADTLKRDLTKLLGHEAGGQNSHLTK